MKKLVTFLYIIVFLLFLIGLDYVCVKFLNSKPFLAYRVMDNSNQIYTGLLYKTYYCVAEDGSYERIVSSPKGNHNCKEVSENDFVIVYEDADTYDPSTKEIEEFFENDEYTCTFKGNRSDKVFLKYDNGDYINIKNALRRGEVQVEVLIEKGINCEKKEAKDEEEVSK